MHSPEAKFVVTLTGDAVTCADSQGNRSTVQWQDLTSVTVATNDTGPWGTDVFWLLQGTKSECLIPGGATGEDVLLKRLQQLEGFDNEAFIAAMGSADNATFVCWRRPHST